jgi:serine/threonine-protein kinase
MRCALCDDLHPEGARECPARRVGTTVAGKYHLTGILGIGGMAAVYEARHTLLGRTVALKMVHWDRSKDVELAGRFLREAREMAGLGHVCIPAVHDTGIAEDGSPYIEMERLVGETLYALRKREGQFSPARTVAITGQILDALTLIHARNMIHRDLKSPNVFVLRDPGYERVKILDFGFAKVADGQALTRANQLLGSPMFMAPEQCIDPTQVDARADIYSLGVIMFELLTGQWPISFTSKRELIRKVMQGEVTRNPREVRPDVPPRLDALVARALARNRQSRPASAGEMRCELDGCL